MDKIEKLLRKIGKKDRLKLQEILEEILVGKFENLDMKNISGSKLFRVRKEKYRAVFQYKKGIVIEAIKIRNEGTYKNLFE